MRNEENFSLWQAFQRGNRDAYRSFYDDYFGMLNNYGSKFSNNKELIEDAIHDLFVRLWTSREQLGTPPSVKNYLLKSLRNTLLRKMKKEEKYTGIDGQTYPLSFTISYKSETVQHIENRELQLQIKTYIDSLPPRQQEVIYLRFYEGLTYEEISQVMEISLNSSYKLLYKALANLESSIGTSSLLSLLMGIKIFY